jgi:hypothetical protein
MGANCIRAVKHRTSHFAETKIHKEQQIEEYGHGDIGASIVKKMSAHERLAKEMKQIELDCEALPLGSHPIERSQYCSQTFFMLPRVVTNKGLVKIKGENIDFVHLLHRN